MNTISVIQKYTYGLKQLNTCTHFLHYLYGQSMKKSLAVYEIVKKVQERNKLRRHKFNIKVTSSVPQKQDLNSIKQKKNQEFVFCSFITISYFNIVQGKFLSTYDHIKPINKILYYVFFHMSMDRQFTLKQFI